jgi:pilus assembly protein CpaE
MTLGNGQSRAFVLGAAIGDPAQAAALRDMCRDLDGVELVLHEGLAGHALPRVMAQRDPDAILIEIDPGDPSTARTAIAAFNDACPRVALLATCGEANLDLARRLMRLGVRELLPAPIAREDLASALASLAGQGPSDKQTVLRSSRVVSFVKAGGGCGATSLAIETAARFAARESPGEPDVCLLDLDLQFGSAALALDLDDQVNLGDLIESGTRRDGALLRSVMGHHKAGIDVVAPPRDVKPLAALDAGSANELLALARAEYSSVIVDLPLAWTDWSHAVLRGSDLVVLVIGPEITDIRRAGRQVRTLRDNGLDVVPLFLVLNRAVRGWGAAARRRETERALGRSFDAWITRDDQAFARAVERGEPVLKAAPWSRSNRELRRLADGIARVLARPRDGAAAYRAGRRPFAYEGAS